MRNRLAVAALTMAGLFSLFPATPASAADAPPPVANKPGDASVPVKQVVLFSSGVGYFEHFGTVQGNGTTELRFKSAQINDILKSLVLQDMDKGRVTAVTYPSQDPVAKTLRSFQVDITSNPSLGELLNQLRGAVVKVSVEGHDMEGTVLGVEKKQRPAGDGGKPGGQAGQGGQVVDSWYLNLISGPEIRQIPLDDVRDVRLADPRLADELHKALAALAAARDQDKKPVTIRFQGEGNRRVRIGYVVETPVWKTSYRLILSSEPGRPGAATQEDESRRADQGAKADNASAKIQGWAIVENQTDNDWNNVELSLVSGRPISFIQDLYQPLYIPRPVVQPELYASLRPQTYEEGLQQQKQAEKFGLGDMDARKPAAAGAPGAIFSKRMAANGAADREQLGRDEITTMIDPTASIASVASAAKVGELFQYTVGDVSLPRQTSSMIPIVADDISARKLSIYNQSVLPRNPLNGAKIKNTTGKHLLAGPVTVFDGGGYAGDAQIDNLPPGQERLISYGIDQQIIVDATKNTSEEAILTGKVVKGVLTLSRKHVFTQEYDAENKGANDKTLVIEHPRRGGSWTLIEPAKPDETTDALYRFIGHVAAGKATKLVVREQLVDAEEVAILPAGVDQLETYIRTGPIPQPVKDALAKAVQLKGQAADTERQFQERQQQIQQISQEQARIRENMKTVAQSTDYYNRLLKKLDEQETSIEKLQKESLDLQQKLDQQRKALQDYLENLNVG